MTRPGRDGLWCDEENSLLHWFMEGQQALVVLHSSAPDFCDLELALFACTDCQHGMMWAAHGELAADRVCERFTVPYPAPSPAKMIDG